MTTIKYGTKKAQGFIDAYDRATAETLYEFYDNFSSAKAYAEKKCRERMEDLDASDFRIMSGNSFTFTCGYRTDDTLYVETSSNMYKIPLKED